MPRAQQARAAAMVVMFLACSPASPSAVGPRPDYASVVRELTAFIEREMADKALPALSVALVDGNDIVWSAGFGLAQPPDTAPATAETVYRVGSIAKLLTATAVMQLVEAGKIELDAPLSRYLPQFRLHGSLEQPVTVRALLAHRGGLVREPPLGSASDSAAVSLMDAALSVNETEAVYPPGSRTKFSNAGYALLGALVQRVSGRTFEDYVTRRIIQPLGLDATSFKAPAGQLATGFLWSYHSGDARAAPTGRFGLPAANDLYSSATDLGRLISAIVGGGGNADGVVLSPESVDQMLTRQFTDSIPSASDFGLGFWISSEGGRTQAGHGGSFHGFATELALLPAHKLGVAVITSKDAANAVPARIAHGALSLMLAARAGEPVGPLPSTTPVTPELARRLDGHYRRRDGAVSADLEERGGKLFLHRVGDDVWLELRMRGDTLVADGRLAYGDAVVPVPRGAVIIDGDTLTRRPVPRPSPPPDRMKSVIGEYGPGHDVVYVREEGGRLHTMVKWFFDYPLSEESGDAYRFPASGLFHGERLEFARDPSGYAVSVTIGGRSYARRAIEPEGGNTFTITPQRPTGELLREALAATPPPQPDTLLPADLVEIAALDPGVRLDIRYATTNNFVQTAFYSQARAFAQRPAALAAVRAHRKLAAQGYGLLVHDAYRPWYVTKMFWDATPDSLRGFVANPASGSRHNRGAAIDLTLYHLATGQPVDMVSGYDEFTDRAYPHYPGGTSLQRWHRALLRRAMEAEGFIVNAGEWWHFDYTGWRRYPLSNMRFEEIK